ncbi:MAG: XTP/dITP diphosphatase [Syntrophomonadaceae bacterium]|jgi:XTP/dITP diphosphohydrolase|nr:XTP/dITP diphosphatase [Syntrophomonadaceae bacterium]
MAKLLLASRNQHKIEELQQMLAGLNIEVISLDDVPDIPVIEEDGNTFSENACKKACLTAMYTGFTCLADDSGLVVDALGGQPGVYSARFAGEDADDRKNNHKLLQMLQGFDEEKRRARFVCVIAISDPQGNVNTVQGTCEGRIDYEERGTEGFGYDPLFIPEGYTQTFAQLSREEKNRISHRGQALLKARTLLADRGYPERGQDF